MSEQCLLVLIAPPPLAEALVDFLLEGERAHLEGTGTMPALQHARDGPIRGPGRRGLLAHPKTHRRTNGSAFSERYSIFAQSFPSFATPRTYADK